MRIEVQVPLDTDPNRFDDLMQTAAKDHGYVLLRRSGMPVDFTETIVVGLADPEGSYPTPSHIALSASLYKLKEGETA